MNKRDQLYLEAIALMPSSTPHMQSILYHNIYSLQVNGGYPFSSREEIQELVEFLHRSYCRAENLSNS